MYKSGFLFHFKSWAHFMFTCYSVILFFNCLFSPNVVGCWLLPLLTQLVQVAWLSTSLLVYQQLSCLSAQPYFLSLFSLMAFYSFLFEPPTWVSSLCLCRTLLIFVSVGPLWSLVSHFTRLGTFRPLLPLRPCTIDYDENWQ